METMAAVLTGACARCPHTLTNPEALPPEAVTGYHPPTDPGTNIVAKTIARLREKLNTGFETKLIETVYGEGYRLSAD